MFPFKCDRLSKLFPVLALSLGLLACASQDGDGGAGSAGSGAGARDDNVAFLASCEGVMPFDESIWPFQRDKLCETVALGLAEGLAAMGRQNWHGKHCLPGDFDLAGFQRSFLEASRSDATSPEQRQNLLLAQAVEKDRGGGNCSWRGVQTLGDLGEACRWVESVFSKDQDQSAYDLYLRSGTKNFLTFRQRGAEALTKCFGYLGGFLAAGQIAVRSEPKPDFCVDRYQKHSRFVGTNDVHWNRLIWIAGEVHDVNEWKPSLASEPASKFLSKVANDEFPCGPEGTPAQRRVAWDRERDSRVFASLACAGNAGHAEEFPYVDMGVYCETFLAGLIEGYAAHQGARLRTSPCLAGGTDKEEIRSALRRVISLRWFSNRLELAMGYELARLSPDAGYCRWQGREEAGEAADSCLRLVEDKGLDLTSAMETGRAIRQEFAALGRSLDEADKQDFSACTGYMQGVVHIASLLSPSKENGSVCIPEPDEMEGTALLMALDIDEAARKASASSDTALSSVALGSAAKRATCEAPASGAPSGPSRASLP